MNKVTTLISVLLLCIASTSHALDLSVNATVASDYMDRGISQNDDAVAVQGGLDLSVGNWFIGTWVSEIEYGDLQYNYYGGVSYDVNEKVNITGTLMRYGYGGTTSGANLDYDELMVDVAVGNVTINLGFSNDVFATGGDGIYANVAYVYPTSIVDVNLSAGYYDLDDAGDGSYGTASVGVSKTLMGFEVSISFITNTSDADSIFGDDPSENTVVGTISYTL